ncbi:hypothetical protein BSKO_05869 [Bryopsis sp. KO-2023]|nr:hypothetical protein BSKO_05869 [Bryopsis sp. KO-2023]
MLAARSLAVSSTLLLALVLSSVTFGEIPEEYIKRCQQLGKSLGAAAMEEGCREVRTKCMNSPERQEKTNKGRKEKQPNQAKDDTESVLPQMPLAARLEERVLMASCSSTLANSCMEAATGAVLYGKDESCKEAFTKGPSPDAKQQCPDLWTVLQIFDEASMKACMTVTPTRADSGGKGRKEKGTLG